MNYEGVTRILFAAIVSFGFLTPNLRGQATQETRTKPQHEPTAAELSHNETVGTALMRTFGNQEYEFRSAAEAMPSEKYNFRPAVQGKFTEAAPFGPTELRTFAGEEFGQQRLVETLRRHRGLRSQPLLEAVVEEVRRFNPSEQQDDITLIVVNSGDP